MPLTPGQVGSSELPGHPLFPDSSSHSAYTYPSLSPSFETLSLNHLQTPLYCQALLRTFPLTFALIETWISPDALLKLQPTHLYLWAWRWAYTSFLFPSSNAASRSVSFSPI